MNDVHISSPRRQRSRQRRHAAILDADMEVVVAEGFDGLTIGRVAEALDVAPGGLYRYFPSKERLIAELTGRAVMRLADELAAARQSWAGSAAELSNGAAALGLLAAGVRWYGELPQREPRLFSLLSQAVAQLEPLIADEDVVPVAAPFRALLGQLEAMFSEAVEAGALPAGDALARALALWSALHGSMLVGKFRRMWPGRPEAFDAAARQELVAGGLLAGWGADGQALQAARCWARGLPVVAMQIDRAEPVGEVPVTTLAVPGTAD